MAYLGGEREVSQSSAVEQEKRDELVTDALLA